MSTPVNGTACDFYPGDYQLPEDIHKSYMINALVNNLLAVTATLGNALILSAFWQSSSLHAPSKALLCSLAATDFLVGVSAQPLAAMYFIASILGERSLCRKVRAVWFPVVTLLSSVSLVLMVLISLDRLLALQMSLRYRDVVTFRRAVIVLIFVWVIAGPILPLIGIIAGKVMYSYVAAVGIILCIIAASLCFYMIYMKLRHRLTKIHPNPVHGDNGAIALQKQQPGTNVADIRYKRFVTTALFLYVAMLLCYIPYFISAAILAVCGWSSGLEAAMAFAETLVMFNSTLNPVIYFWRVKEVWHAARTTLSKIFCRKTSS